VLRHVILGFLTSGARHGYALVKEYKERSGLEVSNGNLYRELQRLVAAGLVKGADRSEGADPRRMPYEITESGRATFDRWLSSPKLIVAEHADELCARALFLEMVDSPIGEQILNRWHDELWVRLKVLERSREVALTASNKSAALRALAVHHARRLKHIAADIEYVQELRVVWREEVAAREVEIERASPRGSGKHPEVGGRDPNGFAKGRTSQVAARRKNGSADVP
jgi:DNA-binding PadR family transcriptional regulator